MTSRTHGAVRATACAAALLCALSAHAAPQLLNEAELSSVYGQGLTTPTLAALTHSEQSQSYGTAQEVATSLAMLQLNGGLSLDKQLSQQQQQMASTGMQSTIKLTQTLAAFASFTAPAPALLIPVLPFGLFFGMMPALPQLPQLPQQPKQNTGH